MVHFLVVVNGLRGEHIVFCYPLEYPKHFVNKSGVNKAKNGDKWSLDQLFGFDCNALSKLLSPQVESVFTSVVEEFHFVSHPISLGQGEELTHVSITLMLSEDEVAPLGKNCSFVLQHLMKILRREQERCSYLTTELQKLLTFRDSSNTWQDLCEKAVTHTSIARDVKGVVCALTGGPTRISINDWIEFSCLHAFQRIPREDKIDLHLALCRKPGVEYHCVSWDDLPALEQVFNCVSPFKSIEDVAYELEAEVDLVCTIASHLYALGCVRRLHKIRPGSLLALRRSCRRETIVNAAGDRWPSGLVEMFISLCSSPITWDRFSSSLGPNYGRSVRPFLEWAFGNSFVVELVEYVHLLENIGGSSSKLYQRQSRLWESMRKTLSESGDQSLVQMAALLNVTLGELKEVLSLVSSHVVIYTVESE